MCTPFFDSLGKALNATYRLEMQQDRVTEWGVEIRYCARCRWLLRASWLAQELLTTFADGSLAQVSLVPDFNGGVFQIHVGERRVWCRREQGRFPEAAELKRAVRDIIAPEQTLGHSETPAHLNNPPMAREGERPADMGVE